VTLPEPPLLLITDRKQPALPLVDVVKAALEAGCRWVSLREKDLPKSEQAKWAEKLLPLVRHFGGQLTIHDNVPVAVALDGAHLPEGGDPRKARSRIGRHKLLGLSVHTPQQAAAADSSVLDYLIAGPVHETASKGGYGPALGAEAIADFVRATPLPVIAIGGIDAPNLAEVMQAGAAGVAVMGSVMRASDPAKTVRELIAVLKQVNR
jgi:thiamine-phosphate pyrophosphorylase